MIAWLGNDCIPGALETKIREGWFEVGMVRVLAPFGLIAPVMARCPTLVVCSKLLLE